MKKLIAILTLLIFSCNNELEQYPGLTYRHTYREAFVNAPPIDSRVMGTDIYSAVNGMSGLWSDHWHFGSRFIDTLRIVHPGEKMQMDYTDWDNPISYPYRLGTGFGTKNGTFRGCFFHGVVSVNVESFSQYRFAVPKIIKNIIVDEYAKVCLDYYECIKEPIEYINSTFTLRDVFVKCDNTKFSVEEFLRIFRKIDSLSESQYWKNRACIMDTDNLWGVFWRTFNLQEFEGLSSYDATLIDQDFVKWNDQFVHHFEKSVEECE